MITLGPIRVAGCNLAVVLPATVGRCRGADAERHRGLQSAGSAKDGGERVAGAARRARARFGAARAGRQPRAARVAGPRRYSGGRRPGRERDTAVGESRRQR